MASFANECAFQPDLPFSLKFIATKMKTAKTFILRVQKLLQKLMVDIMTAPFPSLSMLAKSTTKKGS